MRCERRRQALRVIGASAAALAMGAAPAVPALAASGRHEQAKKPTLASLAKQLKSLRAQDAALRRRVAALSKRVSVAGVPPAPAAVAGPGLALLRLRLELERPAYRAVDG
jgi:hypothetical protein